MPAPVSAADALRAALENPSALRVVHYCCGPFGEGPTAPPVNPICVSDLEGNVQTFMTGRATEREMLGQFFDAVRGNGWGPLVGWNFRDSNYGWPALIRRFVELGGSEPLAHPCINLRAAFDMIYEVPIAEPPLLPNLA